MANPRESGTRNRTVEAGASERVLNNAILAADISQGYEEYLAIFDHFYADDIEATTDTLKEPVFGKAAIRALVAGFLAPLHVFAEIGGLSVSIRHVPISGDRADETHGVWTLELLGVTGARCTVTWYSRRQWQDGRVVSEHHYDHQQIGGPLTQSDLSSTRTELSGASPKHLTGPH